MGKWRCDKVRALAARGRRSRRAAILASPVRARCHPKKQNREDSCRSTRQALESLRLDAGVRPAAVPDSRARRVAGGGSSARSWPRSLAVLAWRVFNSAIRGADGAGRDRRRGRRWRGAQCLRLRGRAPAGDGQLQGHRPHHRGAVRGGRGGAARGRCWRGSIRRRRRRSTPLPTRSLEAARRNLREIEVRLADARRKTLRATAASSSASSSPQSVLDASEAEVAALRGAPGGRARGGRRGAEPPRAQPAGTRRPPDPRAVRRRRDLEGRAAGRDGVADLGRRRIHAHRHRDHRRHGLARDRGGRQRGVHQPRAGRAAGRSRARRLPRLDDPGPRDQHRADGRPTEGHGARAHRVRGARPADPARTWASRCASSRTAGSRPGARPTVPEKAVVRDGDATSVWVVRDGKVERRAVDARQPQGRQRRRC